MIIPMVCFSCGRPIAHLWHEYCQKVKQYELILSNLSESDRQSLSKEPYLSTQVEKDVVMNGEILTHTPEYLALRDLHVGRDCCRRMFLCQHDMYEKIK